MAEKILTEKRAPTFIDNDSIFGMLQNVYPAHSNYSYDFYNSWRRGVERAQKILGVGELQVPGLNILEVACGDGMTGYVLSQYGHVVTLNDISDWRDRRSEHMNYIEGDICQRLPAESNYYDALVSFNSFEHLYDPASAIEEIYRLVKPHGIMIFEFGPLYFSPWGLHAYRTIHMPYAHFLFSREFLNEKFQQIGLKDLGRTMDDLQPLNKWKLKEYMQLWDTDRFLILDLKTITDFMHIQIVSKYPQSFRGMGLDIEDLTTQAISITLRKIAPA